MDYDSEGETPLDYYLSVLPFEFFRDCLESVEPLRFVILLVLWFSLLSSLLKGYIG